MSYNEERENRRQMQKLLRPYGYNGRLDGHYGPIMRQALENYMRAHDGATPTLDQQGPQAGLDNRAPLAPREDRVHQVINPVQTADASMALPRGRLTPRNTN